MHILQWHAMYMLGPKGINRICLSDENIWWFHHWLKLIKPSNCIVRFLYLPLPNIYLVVIIWVFFHTQVPCIIHEPINHVCQGMANKGACSIRKSNTVLFRLVVLLCISVCTQQYLILIYIYIMYMWQICCYVKIQMHFQDGRRQ